MCLIQLFSDAFLCFCCCCFLLFRTLYQFGNITYDRRVVRGNVHAQNIISAVRMNCFLKKLFGYGFYYYYFIIYLIRQKG